MQAIEVNDKHEKGIFGNEKKKDHHTPSWLLEVAKKALENFN